MKYVICFAIGLLLGAGWEGFKTFGEKFRAWVISIFYK
jgi:hypothetical protein